MKQFDPILQKPEKPEIDAIKPIKTEKALVDRIKPKPGQKVWELNRKTGIITEAKFSEEKIILVPKINLFTRKQIGVIEKIVRDIIINENCLYEAATTPEIADYKFMKRLGKPIKKKQKLKTI